jgi:hypothetical protein
MNLTKEQNRLNQKIYRQDHLATIQVRERNREKKFKELHGIDRFSLWKLNNPEKDKAAKKAWVQKNPEKIKQYQENRKLKYSPIKRKESQLKELYGMTLSQYHDMLLSQNNCCALCGLPFGTTVGVKPHIDHDHLTGRIRGILHGQCNIGLGSFKDDVDICEKATQYLKRNR